MIDVFDELFEEASPSAAREPVLHRHIWPWNGCHTPFGWNVHHQRCTDTFPPGGDAIIRVRGEEGREGPCIAFTEAYSMASYPFDPVFTVKRAVWRGPRPCGHGLWPSRGGYGGSFRRCQDDSKQ
jgi:hypothetical protein